MTTTLPKTSGTFTATGASSKVHGAKGVASLDFGTGTVQLRMHDPSLTNPIIIETNTEDTVIVFESPDGLAYDWDLNCSAYTASIAYTLRAS